MSDRNFSIKVPVEHTNRVNDVLNLYEPYRKVGQGTGYTQKLDKEGRTVLDFAFYSVESKNSFANDVKTNIGFHLGL